MASSPSRGQGESFRTQTFEAAFGVTACAQSTDFWLLDTLINIFTLVVLQTVPRGANASVGSIQVLTGSRGTLPRLQKTLIDIHTGPPIGGHLVAFIALALEGPYCIDASAISAKVPISSCTFIDIYAIVVVREDEAVVAAAVEGANGVSAGPVAAGIPFTLIYVQAHGLIGICFKTSVAEAVKAPHRVNTLPMAAYIGDFLTFIAIITLSRGCEAVAGFTVTAVAACRVDTLRIALAHWAVLTLINIFTNQ